MAIGVNPVHAPILRNYWPVFFGVCALEGLFAFAALAAIPAEGGLVSSSRVALLGAIIVPMIGSGALAALARRARFAQRWLDPQSRPRLFSALVWLGGLIAIAALAGLFLLRYSDPTRLLPYFLRLQPVAAYLGVLGAQVCIWGLMIEGGVHPRAFTERRQILSTAGIICAILLLLWGVVAWTGVGITPDPVFWRPPGAPLAFWQLGVAVGLGLLALCLRLQFAPAGRLGRWGDVGIVLAVWLCAVLMWMHVPLDVLRNSQFAPMDPPTGQPFPYSDAANYDTMAQSIRLGSGLMGDIPYRALYILFLTGLHGLAGDDYARLIFLQTMVLAVFPVLGYLVGKALHSRIAGLSVALLMIFREINNLWITPDTEVSNSKELLSDLPAALGVAALTYVCVRWLAGSERKSYQPVLAGGALGLLVLLRTQSVMLLPFLLLAIFLVYRPRWSDGLRAASIVVITLAITVSPWIYRNWRLTGRFIFDEPYSQTEMVAERYAFSQGFDIVQGPAEDEWAFAGRLNAHIVNFSLNYPGYVAGFMANHFMADEIYTLLVLPLDSHFSGGLAANDLYWLSWQQYLTPGNILLLMAYLVVIAFGLAAAWARLRWVGMLPLFFNLAYSLSNAVARNSGWRFILPVDWIGYFYFALGAAEIIFLVAAVLGMRDSAGTEPPASSSAVSRWKPWLAGLAFVVVGAALPILERAVPAHFAPAAPGALLGQIADLHILSASDLAALNSFSQGDGAVIMQGRLLYPRFFGSRNGIVAAHPWPAFATRDFSRLGFVLIRERLENAVMPLAHSPENFPAGADVIAIGCDRGGYLDVQYLALPAQRRVLTADRPLMTCAAP